MSFKPTSAVVWTEIPVTDMKRAMDFYRSVFTYDLTIDDTGPNPISFLPSEGDGTAGHLYPGKPSSDGPTVHLLVPDSLEAAVARVTKAGGKVVSDPIEIPAGRFVYANDLDGNSIGLFEGN